MSASLVGSEMCIRDSYHSEQSYSYPSTSDWVPIGSGPTVTPHALVEAVSYTHLTLPTICSV
eukprot:5571603-Alexandrium_andersonii.AAC.1